MEQINVIGELNEKNIFQSILKKPIELYEPNDDLVINLTQCTWIANSVIPDLLIFGEQINVQKGIKPILFIPSDGKDVSRIKEYLWDIRFVYYAEMYEIFDTRYLRKSDESEYMKRMMPDYCITCGYGHGGYKNSYIQKNEEDRMKMDVLNRYSEIFRKYLHQYYYAKVKTDDDGRKQYIEFNSIQQFIIQIALNAFHHGHRQVYISMQGNRKDGECSIAISDNGQGMANSIVDKDEPMALYSEEHFIQFTDYQRDIVACVEALAYRYDDSVYGLFNVMNELLAIRGWMLIHTDNSQICIDGACKKYIKNISDRKSFARGLMRYLKDMPDRRTQTPYFCGTHFKIFFPVEGDRT